MPASAAPSITIVYASVAGFAPAARYEASSSRVKAAPPSAVIDAGVIVRQDGAARLA